MNERIRDYKSLIDLYQGKIKFIQDKCLHTNKISEYGANTGNYDPYDNCYWVDHHCQDCDKKWMEPK